MTASWSDGGIGRPARQYAYHELTYTRPIYGKAEESKGKQKNGTTVIAGPADDARVKCRAVRT